MKNHTFDKDFGPTLPLPEAPRRHAKRVLAVGTAVLALGGVSGYAIDRLASNSPEHTPYAGKTFFEQSVALQKGDLGLVAFKPVFTDAGERTPMSWNVRTEREGNKVKYIVTSESGRPVISSQTAIRTTENPINQEELTKNGEYLIEGELEASPGHSATTTIEVPGEITSDTMQVDTDKSGDETTVTVTSSIVNNTPKFNSVTR